MNFDLIGGRKFVLAIIIIGVCTGIQLKTGAGITESFTALMIGIMAAFGATNAYVTAKVGSEQKAEPASAPEAPQAAEPAQPPEEPQQIGANDLVIQAINELNGKIELMASAVEAVSEQAKSANKNATAALSALAGKR